MLLLFALPLIGACGGGEEKATPVPVGDKPAIETKEPTPEVEKTTPAPVAQISEFEVVKEAVATYVANPAANIKAADLFMQIAENEAPYIVSIRSAEDYAKGHIPGAVNIKFSELATLPIDEEIVVYCYTGQSASSAAAVLGTLGYDVQNLLHGMSSWTTNPDVFVRRFDATTHQSDYAIETTPNEPTETSVFPELDNTASSDEAEILKAAAAATTLQYIMAGDLFMLINDEDEDNDPFIISARKSEDYAKGHIPGAVNIELKALADNLSKIPADRDIVVYCYTGHTSSQMMALLNMLGYDVKSLAFGMCSWTSDEAVHLNKCFDASTVTDRKVEQ